MKQIPIEEKDGETEDYLYFDDIRGLLACVQMGTMEFHGWGSKVDKVECPDRLVFDLDPDEGLDFGKVKEAAVRVRDLVAQLGLKSFPLLTGGKGIHVVVPLDATAEWPEVKSFADRFSRAVSEAEPGPLHRQHPQGAAHGADLHRLAAQPARSDGGHALLRPRPRRRTGGGADRVGRARRFRQRPRFLDPRRGRAAEAREVEAACRLGKSEAIASGCIAAPAQHSSRSSSFSLPRRLPSFSNGRSRRERVTITRDDWGIAHVKGKTDADAVFGMIYAQAEDDFPRIEANYLTNLGRTAEAEGEKAIWQDLRARLYVSDR